MTRKDKEERGLAGAISRGRAAREAWVQDGVLVSREQFADRWGVSVEELAQMVAKGELFELEVQGQMWMPAVLLEVSKEAVVEVNRALTWAGVDAATALVFWHRRHGALGETTVVDALRTGGLMLVVQTAHLVARQVPR
ncbi:hypothetical protein [Hydrogenophaga crocea]|uniref:Uncharacterized protein n=1 Tax=Hydrogenophaga crocea TaxID=2716225 RepID=A0A6G8IIE8_9BURK|nr:hypothetical protein [Hydrogenophaga crocea]QIM52828.1 hypothetical protein G9Q37_12065 [Hydrogenophaga crocea]